MRSCLTTHPGEQSIFLDEGNDGVVYRCWEKGKWPKYTFKMLFRGESFPRKMFAKTCVTARNTALGTTVGLTNFINSRRSMHRTLNTMPTLFEVTKELLKSARLVWCQGDSGRISTTWYKLHSVLEAHINTFVSPAPRGRPHQTTLPKDEQVSIFKQATQCFEGNDTASVSFHPH